MLACERAVTLMLDIKRLQLGPMANFVYLLAPVDGERLAVVDPGWDAQAILAAAARSERQITDIILTHHHHDHRNAVEALLSAGSARVWVNRGDAEWLGGTGWTSDCQWLSSGDCIELGGAASVQVIGTPGHTPGSQCLLCTTAQGPMLLTGDTLFIDGCGRCDLPGGDPAALYHSLYGMLGDIDGRTQVCPGHDYAPLPQASLAEQRATNPYLHFDSVAAFVGYRMRPRA
ncbi:MAG: MBL fold metallo-hydrolase [Myxococcales bacterium]|nr:MBL fold metallo-hydrolase [Myxococcales bacterium]